MPANDPQPDERWMAVARLLRPQGRRGEILADPLTDLYEIFAPGAEFRLAAGPDTLSSTPTCILQESWQPQGRNAGRVVLKLDGVDSISAAEALATRTLFLPASRMPALDTDTYLVGDLIGCSLFDGDRFVGTITDLQFPIGADGRTRLADAADLLVVEPEGAAPDAEPVLVPFIKAWLIRVDLPQKQIHMNLPPGLFDSPEIPEAS